MGLKVAKSQPSTRRALGAVLQEPSPACSKVWSSKW
jgi:hypothetical protein